MHRRDSPRPDLALCSLSSWSAIILCADRKHSAWHWVERQRYPKANVEKMSSGQPLDIRELSSSSSGGRPSGRLGSNSNSRWKGRALVISCSALKKYYRNILRGKQKQKDLTTIPLHSADIEGAQLGPDIVLPTYFVFIDGTRELLIEKMEKRPAYFMKASMLDSQVEYAGKSGRRGRCNCGVAK
jgi:gluconate kinase